MTRARDIIRTNPEVINVKAGALSLIYLVFRTISHSLLTFAFDWYAQHGANSSESPTNVYDVNGASVGLAQMFLVPIVFLLVFPFVKVFLSNWINPFTFSWLASLLGIGTFLSLFFCFIYSQQNLFYFAFFSIGIAICLLSLKLDLVEYLMSNLPRKYVMPFTVSIFDEIREIYLGFFGLLDFAGTLLGSVGSSIIIEFFDYPVFLHVVTFSMCFVFVGLCSLPLLKYCNSCNQNNSSGDAIEKAPAKSKDDDKCEAKPYFYRTYAEPRVMFKRIVTKFV
jgi:hypothetical protein